MATTVMGQEISLPVVISPTGVQAVHPDGEVAVARAAAARGTADGAVELRVASRSRRSSRPARTTFFQMYWTGDRDVMVQRMRARARGRREGPDRHPRLVVLDGPRLGQPEIPEKVDLQDDGPDGAEGGHQAALALRVRQDRADPRPHRPQPAPRRRPEAPTFFGAYYEWMTTPPPSWDDVAWMREQWTRSAGRRSCSRASAGSTTPAAPSTPGVTAISVSNHGGNNLDGTPATIRLLHPIADAVGDQIEVRHGRRRHAAAPTSSRRSPSAPGR